MLTPETVDRLKAQLLTSGLSQQNSALFQVINLLIDAVRQALFNSQQVTGGSSGGGGILGATYLTENNETGSLPNSRKVIAGAGIQFNDSPNGIRVISTAIPFGMDSGGEGEDGPPGPPGRDGATGAPGVPGTNAISQLYAFDGIDGEDAPILPGPAGAQGIQGVAGVAGMQGIPGLDGTDGLDSFLPGPAGINGTIGKDGLPGPPGFDAEEVYEPIPIPGLAAPTGNGFNLTPFTKDLGVDRRSGTFDLTVTSVNISSSVGRTVTVVQTTDPIVSKGNARDEIEMDMILASGYVLNSNTIRVYWFSANGSIVVGTYNFGFAVNVGNAGPQGAKGDSGFQLVVPEFDIPEVEPVLVTSEYKSSGVWTPVLASSGGGAPTYTTQTGSWIKEEGKITGSFLIVLATAGTLAAGNLTVDGLPFLASPVNGIPFLCIFAGLGVNQIYIYNVVNPSTTQLLLRKQTAAAAGNATNLTFADITGAFVVAGGFVYFT